MDALVAKTHQVGCVLLISQVPLDVAVRTAQGVDAEEVPPGRAAFAVVEQQDGNGLVGVHRTPNLLQRYGVRAGALHTWLWCQGVGGVPRLCDRRAVGEEPH